VMEAVSTSETLFNFYQRNIRGDSHLHTRRHENLKPHMLVFFLFPCPCWFVASWIQRESHTTLVATVHHFPPLIMSYLCPRSATL
jgi:hypothetical protein